MGIDTLRIETPRLILRPTRWEDFDAWAAFLADEESTRFLGGVQSRPLAWRSMIEASVRNSIAAVRFVSCFAIGRRRPDLTLYGIWRTCSPRFSGAAGSRSRPTGQTPWALTNTP